MRSSSLAAFGFSLMSLTSSAAQAQQTDAKSSFEFRRLVAEGAALLQGAAPSLLPPPKSAPVAEKPTLPQTFIGLSPRFSVVARDWSGAQGLGGTVLTDELRTTRSNRMVVGRVRFANGRINPFVQVGLGQWRVDRDLMPNLPLWTELAAQLAFGFEVRVAKRGAIALECDYTAFYRDTAKDRLLPMSSLVGAFGAARFEF